MAQTLQTGSKNLSEQFVVVESYAQALEKGGMEVERNRGTTQTALANENQADTGRAAAARSPLGS